MTLHTRIIVYTTTALVTTKIKNAVSVSLSGGLRGRVHTGVTEESESRGHKTILAVGILTGLSAGGTHVRGKSFEAKERSPNSDVRKAPISTDSLSSKNYSAKGDKATDVSKETALNTSTEDTETFHRVAVVDSHIGEEASPDRGFSPDVTRVLTLTLLSPRLAKHGHWISADGGAANITFTDRSARNGDESATVPDANDTDADLTR